MAEPILVVDVGTSGTRVALVVGDRSGLIREPGATSYVWPSSVCLDDAGYLIGTAAERRKRALPRRYIDGPRRAVDARASMWLEQREVTGTEAVTVYLTAVRGEAEQQYGAALHRLTLTVPADYGPGDPRRDAMVAAGTAAGFADVELVSDAVCAALDPETGGGLPAGGLVLVCDLGTMWTAAVVQVGGNHTTQLAHQTASAGFDLDALLVDDLRSQGRAWLEPLLAAPGDAGLRAYYEAIEFTRRLKHELAAAEEVTDHLTPLAPPYRLTREWLAAFAEPAVRWLVASCHAVLEQAGAAPADLAAVVLAGGSARLPMVAPALHAGLGLPVRASAEPELAVARGAARWSVGAATRVIPAEPPRWQVEPLFWEIPGGVGDVVRWLVPEGGAYQPGEVVVQVRGSDERVFDLVAAQAGTLLSHRAAAGDRVGPVLVAAAAKAPKALAERPPPRRWRQELVGSWLLAPDRQRLVACDGSGRHVRIHDAASGAVLSELAPEPGEVAPRGGRVFVGPAGVLFLVAWDAAGWFSVWDLDTGTLATRFCDPAEPDQVLVDETGWRLAAEARGKVAVGRYRRSTVTVWDLRTGARVDKVNDDSWARRHPGFTGRSAADGFVAAAASPDGQLRAAAGAATDGTAVLLVHDVATDDEVFRARGEPGQRVRVGFSADGCHLLAEWEHGDRSVVDVWAI
ncbi:Hsp70 family protein [Actinomycetes bacterium KLBMP 9797]